MMNSNVWRVLISFISERMNFMFFMTKRIRK